MYGILKNGELIATFAAPLTVRNNRPVFASDSLNLKRNINVRPAQRWEIQSNLVPLSTDANELFVAIALSDYYQTIEVKMPQNTGSVHNRVTTGNTSYASGSLNGTTVSVTTTGAIFRIKSTAFCAFAAAETIHRLFSFSFFSQLSR